MATLADRFESKVDRSGDHHLWLGSKKADGTGTVKVGGTVLTARRVAWELAHGPLPSTAKVRACPQVKSCVRLEHLSVEGSGVRSSGSPAKRERSPWGGGSKVEVRAGVWKLTVSAGRFSDGRQRRESKTVFADTEAEANRELARFVAEVHSSPLPETQTDRDITVDAAVEQCLTGYLTEEKGREANTIRDYRNIHRRWFSPEIGGRRVRDIDDATMDRIFGRMRQAGLSASRMNSARSLYVPFFRWAKRRNIIRRSPMTDFELPTSTQVAKERVAPEVDQLCFYLQAASEVVPDVAPLLVLHAVSGLRRGELVTIRRSALSPHEGRIRVATAADADGKRIKTTKTRRERDVHVDDETIAMLVRHCTRMDERAAMCGATVAPDGFVFSIEPDCSAPMPADHLTKQVAKLKDHLGIADKRPETIRLEDQALQLRREPTERRKGQPGPTPESGGMSFAEIGKRLGRSDTWARKAVAAAERREADQAPGEVEWFDGSILAPRKFTSSELLDAGFNIKAVAQRQGHGPEVLLKHYAKARPSADRKAATHLGRVIHGRVERV